MRLTSRRLLAALLALGVLLAFGGGVALVQEPAGPQSVFLPAIFRAVSPAKPTPTPLVLAVPAPPPTPPATATPTATPEPTAVVVAPAPPAATPTPTPAGVPLRTSPGALALVVGGTATFDLVLDGGSQSFDAVQVYLTFDPRLVEVVDADPARAGVQVTPGASLSDVLLNGVDNAQGRLQFAAGRSIAQPPPSGTLVIATVELRGRAEGTSPLTFEANSSAAFAGRRIPLQLVPGSVAVRAP